MQQPKLKYVSLLTAPPPPLKAKVKNFSSSKDDSCFMGKKTKSKFFRSTNCHYLGVGIIDQPVVELNGLYEVLNGDSLVEAVEPFCIILCDKRRGEPGNGQDQTNISSFLACRSSPQDVDSVLCPCWL